MNARAFLLAAAVLSLAASPALVAQEARAERGSHLAERDVPKADWRGHQAKEADERSRWFPDTTPFAPLLAAPREASLRGAFVLAERSHIDAEVVPGQGEPRPFAQADFEGRNLEADVALGLRIPVLLLRRESESGPSLVLEFEVGTFSRFFMETPQMDLINIDYQVGVPLSAGWRDWEGRMQVLHTSSHIGDDFIRRFGISNRTVSMEGVELLLARRFRDVRAYVGGEAYSRSSRELERTAARAGVELDPHRTSGGAGPSPYAAVDFRLNSAVERIEGTGVAGVAFRLQGIGLRFEGRGHFGPSAMGWLRRSNETLVGIGMRVEL